MAKRMGRWVPAALIVGCIGALGLLTPRLLRGVDAFRVEQVEVVGTRYLAPHDVLDISGITGASSVFDDTEPWVDALTQHPMVQRVEVERRIPNTVVLRVHETEPLALVRTPELRLVDSRGRLLPVDPAGLAVDLPVLTLPEPADTAEGPAVAADGPASTVLGMLERIRGTEPELAARISEAQPTGDGVLRLRLREPASAEVLLPVEADALHLRKLRLTLTDLASKGELSRVRRIDLRFRDQVVVSLTPSASS